MELRDELSRGSPNTYRTGGRVSVTEVKSFKVSVMGAVVKPGHRLRSRATVIDVLAMAEASPVRRAPRVVVMRSDGSRVERLPFDYDKVASGSSGQANFYVRAGDIVLVP
jgi:protein involved in polysaccharide export with SLBB domain